jgi:hypothetical protein
VLLQRLPREPAPVTDAAPLDGSDGEPLRSVG